MRTIRHTSQFKRDVKRMKKRGKDMAKYRDHMLAGGYRGTRECHIAPDWLLIYELAESEAVLIRTGTHADLFQ
jgi:mRNA interferase YafQ